MELARKTVYVSHPLDSEWIKFAAICKNTKLSQFCDIFVPTKTAKHTKQIKDADIFVADVTKNSFVVGLETGIAMANNKPILFICRRDDLPSKAMYGIAKSISHYTNIFQICDIILAEIRKI
jgi:hypothetical protein